jgi:hypothetical protein
MLYRKLHGHNLEQLGDKEITGGGRAARAYANLAKYAIHDIGAHLCCTAAS